MMTKKQEALLIKSLEVISLMASLATIDPSLMAISQERIWELREAFGFGYAERLDGYTTEPQDTSNESKKRMIDADELLDYLSTLEAIAATGGLSVTAGRIVEKVEEMLKK